MINLRRQLIRSILSVLASALLTSLGSAFFAGSDTLAEDSRAAGVGDSSEVFDPSRMATVYLYMLPADWERMRNRERGWVPVTVIYRDQAERDQVFYPVGVQTVDRSREGDCFLTHPNLRFQFGRFDPTLRFYGMNMLTVRSFCGDDNTLLVEEVEIKLFNEFGIPTERLAHVRLFVDTGSGPEYIGPYNIVDRDKDDMSNIMPRIFPGNSDGPLYLLKNTGSRVPTDAFMPLDGQPRDDPDSYIPSAFRLTTSNPGDGMDILALILAFDPPNSQEILRLLDLDHFIDYLAADMTFGDTDGFISYDVSKPDLYFQNNCFFYHNPQTGKFFVFPEDLDDGLVAVDPDVVNRGLTDGWDLFTVTRWMQSDDAVMAQYRARVRLFLDNVFRPDNLRSYVSQRAALIRFAVQQDTNKPLTDEQWEARVQQLMDYFETREQNVRNDPVLTNP